MISRNTLRQMTGRVVLTMLLSMLSACSTTVYYAPQATDVPSKLNVKEASDLVTAMFRAVPDARIESTVFSFMNWGQDEITARVSAQGIQLTQRNSQQTASIKWSKLNYVGLEQDWNGYYHIHDGPPKQEALARFAFTVGAQDARQAKQFADAINWFIYQAKGGNSAQRTADFESFKTQAKAWRELAGKPALPAETQRQRILAEDAVKNRQFGEALEHYEVGLAVSPLWPEGQYNAALLSAEMESFRQAVDHMRRYLELVPDAPEAGTLKEKIIIWEEKAK